jgi:glucose/arabinose dehydrogenase
LLGKRFNSPNPFAGLFTGPEQAVTNPFQPFGVSNRHRIPGIPPGKPPKFSGGLFSVAPDGGDLRMAAHGIRRPRGLAFDEYWNLYFTNNGMELRGTRPIRDDPDTVLRWWGGQWYGWPDYTADLQPVTEKRYQPPLEMIFNTGYPDAVTFLIDHPVSFSKVANYLPNPKEMLAGEFPSQSGAAGIKFVPGNAPGNAFKQFHGSAVIALSGDRAPFATGGRPLKGPVGYKVVLLNPDRNQVSDFIRNTHEGPASAFGGTDHQLERPIDVAFSPADGSLYVLDFGRMRIKNGQEDVTDGTGQVFRLSPTRSSPATAPTTAPPPTRAIEGLE